MIIIICKLSSYAFFGGDQKIITKMNGFVLSILESGERLPSVGVNWHKKTLDDALKKSYAREHMVIQK